MDPWDLVLRHRYAEAVAAYDARLRQREDSLDLANRSTALLCLGKLEEALAGFRQANELRHNELRGESSPYLKHVAVIQWLLGDRAGAVQTLRDAVEGLASGTILFADFAGGVSPGVLLWYAGVSTNDVAVQGFALKYLKSLSKKSRIKYWPGPLALYVLGRMPFEQVVEAATGVRELSDALEKANGDLLARRQLCQALFHDAVKTRAAGDKEGCLRGMRACAELENPIIEQEWYLARWEVQQGSGAA